MLTLNARTQRYLKTLPLMGATRPASEKMQVLYSKVRVFLFHYPDAGRVAPISASVWC